MPPGSYVLREAAGVLAARLVQRLLPGPARPAHPYLVGAGPGCRRGRPGDPARAGPRDPAGRAGHARLRRPHRAGPGHGGGGRLRRRDGGHPWGGVFAPGEVCDVAGTAEPVCAASAGPGEDPAMLVECHPHADPDVWLLENPGFVSGGNFRWWRDQFAPLERDAEARGQGDAYDLLTGPAAAVPPGAEGLVFLPCMQGAMAPEWNGGRPRRLLRPHPGPHPGPHDPGAARGLRLCPARHPRGHGQRRPGRPPPHDRRRRGQGPPVAPDQGRRDRPAGARPDQRRDHRHRGRHPWPRSAPGSTRPWPRRSTPSSPTSPTSTSPTPSATRSTARPTATTATYTSPSSRCSSDSVTRPTDGGLAMFVQVIQGQVADAEQVHAALDRWARELAPRRRRLARLDRRRHRRRPLHRPGPLRSPRRRPGATATGPSRTAGGPRPPGCSPARPPSATATTSSSTPSATPGAPASSRSSRAAAATPTAPGS